MASRVLPEKIEVVPDHLKSGWPLRQPYNIMWRVLLSKKKWDQKNYEELYTASPDARRLPQSKGALPMKRVPERGDIVQFEWCGQVVMRGRIDSDGFENGTEHQVHTCNRGTDRTHATASKEYTWIMITEIGLSEPIKWRGQRTWVWMEPGQA